MFDTAPEEWREAVLSDVAEIVTAGISADELATKPEVHHYSLPAFDLGIGPEIGPGEAIKSNKTVVPEDCILFSKLNPRIPRIWRVREIASPDSYCSTEFWPLVRKSDDVDLDFLTYFLGSTAFLGNPAIVPSSSTNSHQRVDRRSFESFVLPLPPLDEQRRIAEVLRAVDETIGAQSEVCRQLEVTFDSLAEACFTTSIGTENWPVSPLGDLCESIQVGIVVRPASYYVETGGIPALRSLNVGENRLDLDDLVYISAEGHLINRKSSLRPGDVVTRRTGEPGKTAVITQQFPDGLNCIDIIFTRPKAILRPEFFSFFMNSDAAKRQVAGLQGGLAQQHLNVGEMKKMNVPLPALEAQDEVVATLKATWDRTEGEKALLRRLRSLRSAIGVDLLSGRIRVPT